MTVSKAIVVDSSGWVEAAGRGAKAPAFQKVIAGEVPLLMPTIVVYEVYKKLLQSAGKTVAERFVSHALRQEVVALDAHIALAAAEAGIKHRLPMADAIIYATARLHDAKILTADAHFQGLPGVTLI